MSEADLAVTQRAEDRAARINDRAATLADLYVADTGYWFQEATSGEVAEFVERAFTLLESPPPNLHAQLLAARDNAVAATANRIAQEAA